MMDRPFGLTCSQDERAAIDMPIGNGPIPRHGRRAAHCLSRLFAFETSRRVQLGKRDIEVVHVERKKRPRRLMLFLRLAVPLFADPLIVALTPKTQSVESSPA